MESGNVNILTDATNNIEALAFGKSGEWGKKRTTGGECSVLQHIYSTTMTITSKVIILPGRALNG